MSARLEHTSAPPPQHVGAAATTKTIFGPGFRARIALATVSRLGLDCFAPDSTVSRAGLGRFAPLDRFKHPPPSKRFPGRDTPSNLKNAPLSVVYDALCSLLSLYYYYYYSF
jgi:hypothetical protein